MSGSLTVAISCEPVSDPTSLRQSDCDSGCSSPRRRPHRWRTRRQAAEYARQSSRDGGRNSGPRTGPHHRRRHGAHSGIRSDTRGCPQVETRTGRGAVIVGFLAKRWAGGMLTQKEDQIKWVSFSFFSLPSILVIWLGSLNHCIIFRGPIKSRYRRCFRKWPRRVRWPTGLLVHRQAVRLWPAECECIAPYRQAATRVY